MAFDWQNRSTARPASWAEIDVGLRQHMLRVYNYMAGGLALTGVIAYVAAASGFYVSLLSIPLLFYAVIFAPLALVFFLSYRIQAMSLGAAQATFWIYSALMGLSLGFIFLVYTHASIASTFFITAAMFLGMSLYGYTTGRDLSAVGSFMIMGLWGIIIASLVNLFLLSSGVSFVISIVGVVVFTGLTAWDTQKIKEMYVANDDGKLVSVKGVVEKPDPAVAEQLAELSLSDLVDFHRRDPEVLPGLRDGGCLPADQVVTVVHVPDDVAGVTIPPGQDGVGHPDQGDQRGIHGRPVAVRFAAHDGGQVGEALGVEFEQEPGSGLAQHRLAAQIIELKIQLRALEGCRHISDQSRSVDCHCTPDYFPADRAG
jgi:FtsH-binding integral membrane protein